MGVDGASPKTSEEILPQQLHESRRGHHVGLKACDNLCQLGIPLITIQALDERMGNGGHPRGSGPFQGVGSGLVGDHRHDPGIHLPRRNGVEKSLQQGS